MGKWNQKFEPFAGTNMKYQISPRRCTKDLQRGLKKISAKPYVLVCVRRDLRALVKYNFESSNETTQWNAFRRMFNFRRLYPKGFLPKGVRAFARAKIFLGHATKLKYNAYEVMIGEDSVSVT